MFQLNQRPKRLGNRSGCIKCRLVECFTGGPFKAEHADRTTGSDHQYGCDCTELPALGEVGMRYVNAPSACANCGECDGVMLIKRFLHRGHEANDQFGLTVKVRGVRHRSQIDAALPDEPQRDPLAFKMRCDAVRDKNGGDVETLVLVGCSQNIKNERDMVGCVPLRQRPLTPK